MEKLVIGVDPGCFGAVAVMRWLDAVRTIEKIVPTPSQRIKEGSKRRRVLLHQWIDEIITICTEYPDGLTAVIEHMQPFPKMSSISMAPLMENYGAIKATLIVLGVPFTTPRPQDWKKAILEGTAKDKIAAIQYVQTNYPAVVIPPHPEPHRKGELHDGVADAICLAEWGLTR